MLSFRQLAQGFPSSDLRQQLAALSGRDPESVSQGAVTYQLRRLRLHGLIERLPNSFRYRVTQFGLRPGLAAALPNLRAADATLKPAFDKIDEQINAWINQAKLAA